MSRWATSSRRTDRGRAVEEKSFDYVIVGAGSAGCVLANRLTADGRHTVLLLEYGGSDRSIFIQMPSALAIPMNRERYNWFYHTEPEPGLGGRRIHTPRGKVLGGSSSINGLVYIRGNAFDFERWEAEGAKGWGYRHVLPYFKRAERRAEGGDEDAVHAEVLLLAVTPQGQLAGVGETQRVHQFEVLAVDRTPLDASTVRNTAAAKWRLAGNFARRTRRRRRDIQPYRITSTS